MAGKTRQVGLIAFFVLTAFACTDANLNLVNQPPQAFALRQEVTGKLCAPADITEMQPYKLLFLIDISYSTLSSDPTPVGGISRRQKAVADIVNKYTVQQHLTNVSYGVITFSDTPYVQTATFTNDLSVISAATANISVSQGATDYSDTILSASQFIQADLATLSNQQAHITHYEVLFLTDGVPTLGVTDPNGVLPFVQSLVTIVSPRVAELKFNTAFLGGASDVSAAETAEAASLLQSMAKLGSGTFNNIPQGEQFSFDVNIAPVTRKFALQSVMVTNRNTLFGHTVPEVDSDGDHLPDVQEKALGSDPTRIDTDGDGFTDGFEALYPGALDPLHSNLGCANPNIGIDTDQDGLLDCEETYAGTDVTNPDTNGNYLLDSIELFAGSSPLIASSTGDFDLDGFTNDVEVKSHLQVRVPNTAADMQTWGYAYSSSATTTAVGSTTCYDISVDNVSMYETLALPGSGPAAQRGHNNVEVLTAYAPADGGGPTLLFRGTYVGNLILPEIETPLDGTIPITNDVFTQLPVAPSAISTTATQIGN